MRPGMPMFDVPWRKICPSRKSVWKNGRGRPVEEQEKEEEESTQTLQIRRGEQEPPEDLKHPNLELLKKKKKWIIQLIQKFYRHLAVFFSSDSLRDSEQFINNKKKRGRKQKETLHCHRRGRSCDISHISSSSSSSSSSSWRILKRGAFSGQTDRKDERDKRSIRRRDPVFDGHPPGGWVDEYKKVGGQSVIVVTGNSTQRNVAKSP